MGFKQWIKTNPEMTLTLVSALSIVVGLFLNYPMNQKGLAILFLLGGFY